MKSLVLIIMLLTLSLSSFAQDADVPPPAAVYKVGTVYYFIPRDTVSSSVTVDGHTTFAHCNSSGNSIDCSEGLGSRIAVRFAGHRYVVSESDSSELFDMLLDKCDGHCRSMENVNLQFKFRLQDGKLCRPVSQHEVCYHVTPSR
jgi:hypothetical protein